MTADFHVFQRDVFQRNVFQMGPYIVGLIDFEAASEVEAFRPPVFLRNDPTLTGPGRLRVWDDYQFRRKGIKWSGGAPEVNIVSADAATVREDARLRHILGADRDRVSPLIMWWEIVGGADAAQFQLSYGVPWALTWSQNGTRDFDAPADADGDNIYTVVVQGTDTAGGGVATQTIAVTVLPVGLDVTPPIITSSASISNVENTSLAHLLTANEPVTWTKVAGGDAAHFTLTGSTLSWTSGTKDFEDSHGPVYGVMVRATDTAGNPTDQSISVTVTDVVESVDTTPPTITSAAAVSNVENTTLSHLLTASETVSWSKVGGADSSHFTLAGSTLSWTSGTRDFEDPHGPAYVVVVRATDLAGLTADQTVTVTVTDVAEGTAPVNVIPPVVSGTTVEGETLTCTTVSGDWSGTPPITFGFRWYRVAEPVPPGTALTDEGEALTVDGEELTT